MKSSRNLGQVLILWRPNVYLASFTSTAYPYRSWHAELNETLVNKREGEFVRQVVWEYTMRHYLFRKPARESGFGREQLNKSFKESIHIIIRGSDIIYHIERE